MKSPFLRAVEPSELDALREEYIDTLKTDFDRLIHRKKEAIKSYYSLPSIWLDPLSLDLFATIFFKSKMLVHDAEGVEIVDHTFDPNHFFIKLPDDDYTAALLSKGLEQLTMEDPEVSVLRRNP